MRRKSSVIPVAAAICLGGALVFEVAAHASVAPVSRTGGDAKSRSCRAIWVTRTQAGLLEVSRITVTEQFDKSFAYAVRGQKAGGTVAHIVVLAVPVGAMQ